MISKNKFLVCFLILLAVLGGGFSVYAYGASNHGTLINMNTTGNATSGWTSGGVNGTGALLFDGINDYVNMGNADIFNFGTGEFSVLLWIKPDKRTGGCYPICGGDADFISKMDSGLWDAPWSAGWGLGVQSTGNSSLYILGVNDPDDDEEVLGSTNILDGNWHFVAGMKNSTHYNIWVDGIKENEEPIGTNPNVNNIFPLALAKGVIQTSDYLNGTMDEVRLYNRTLSAAEIADMYENFTNITSGLVGFWALNDGSGDTARDSS